MFQVWQRDRGQTCPDRVTVPAEHYNAAPPPTGNTFRGKPGAFFSSSTNGNPDPKDSTIAHKRFNVIKVPFLSERQINIDFNCQTQKIIKQIHRL